MSPRPIVVQTINASRCSRSGFILTHGWNSVFPGTYIPQEASGEVDLGKCLNYLLVTGWLIGHGIGHRTDFHGVDKSLRSKNPLFKAEPSNWRWTTIFLDPQNSREEDVGRAAITRLSVCLKNGYIQLMVPR